MMQKKIYFLINLNNLCNWYKAKTNKRTLNSVNSNLKIKIVHLIINSNPIIKHNLKKRKETWCLPFIIKITCSNKLIIHFNNKLILYITTVINLANSKAI
jgi:hypothetical protein